MVTQVEGHHRKQETRRSTLPEHSSPRTEPKPRTTFEQTDENAAADSKPDDELATQDVTEPEDAQPIVNDAVETAKEKTAEKGNSEQEPEEDGKDETT